MLWLSKQERITEDCDLVLVFEDESVLMGRKSYFDL
jgi:hypothetical protein